MSKCNKSSTNKCSELQCMLREPMRLCRWSGFFPVDGLSESMISKLRCSLSFPYIVFHVVSVMGQVLTTGLNLISFFSSSYHLQTSSNFVFYSTALITTILLIKLAKNWTKLIKRTLDIETTLAGIRKSRNLATYRSIAYIVMCLAIVEHILSIISKLYVAMSNVDITRINEEVLEIYFKSSMPFIFNFTNYGLWKAIPFAIANIQATFLWNVTDVMIMYISIYLTSYFKDLNDIINDNKNSKSIPWEELRILYSNLVALVKEVDSKFCYLVLLSFFTNLFFISFQLFNTLINGLPLDNANGKKNSISALHLTYYIYSFVFLMTRASVMCLLAANVHRAAQEPLFVVGYVPASEYTLEVQRFIRQIRYTTTALSGVYFYVTRSTLLKVVGTLLTYELVLLQFNLNKHDSTARRRHIEWKEKE